MNWTCPLCKNLFVFAEKKPHHNAVILEHLYREHKLLSCQKVAAVFALGRKTISRQMVRLGLNKVPRGSLLGEFNHNYGKQASAETRQRQSNAQKERFKREPSPMRGRIASNITRRKLSDAHKQLWQDPKYRQHMSEAHSGPGHSGENHPRWMGGPVTRICVECGNQFEVPRSYVTAGIGRFCSRTCYGKWQSRERTGHNNPSWKGGPFPYGYLWPIQRKRARNRDNHICQLCGATKEEIGREVDVHHICSFRESRDHTLPNLICLCWSCHKHCEHHREDCPEPRKNWLLSEAVVTGECYSGI